MDKGDIRAFRRWHVDAAKQVIKYLQSTPDWGIMFTEPPQQSTSHDPELCFRGLVAWPPAMEEAPVPVVDRFDTYTDSNWGPQDASHPKPGETRRLDETHSLLGSMITYLGGLLDWNCCREKRISLSVCQSEIKAMNNGYTETLALRQSYQSR